jgi:hypothetical protein
MSEAAAGAAAAGEHRGFGVGKTGRELRSRIKAEREYFFLLVSVALKEKTRQGFFIKRIGPRGSTIPNWTSFAPTTQVSVPVHHNLQIVVLICTHRVSCCMSSAITSSIYIGWKIELD